MTINESDVKRQRRQHEQQFEPSHDDKWGEIAAVNGLTSPPGRRNMTYVDMYKSGTSVLAVWNDTMLSKAGTPVQLGNDPKPPGIKIIGPFTKGEVPNSTVDLGRFNIPPHGPNHQYLSETVIGDDPTLIYQPAMQVLKTTGNGVNLTVSTQAYGRFPGADTNLTSDVPATAGHVRRVLIYYDRAQNKIATIQGEAVLDNGAIPVPYPDAPENSTPSAFVRLANGQTAITTVNHIEDARDFLASGSDLALEDLIDVTFTDLADGEVLIYDAAENEWINGAGGSGSGDVVGPASATDEAIARFDGTTGKLLQDSLVLVSDAGIVSGAIRVSVAGSGALYVLGGDAGTNRAINMQTAGSDRWIVRVNNATESGSNAGSNFQILSRDDSGGALATPFAITRATGQVIIGNANITGGAITGITDLAVDDGGTGASDASGARTNLGLVIGTNIQAWNNNLDNLAAMTPTKGTLLVGNGSVWVEVGVGTNTHVLTADSAETTGLKWAAQTGGSGTPAGSDTHVQFNDGGTFGGLSTFAFNKTTGRLALSTTGVNAGLLIGGDVLLYRSAADVLTVPDAVSITGLLTLSNGITANGGVVFNNADAAVNFQVKADGPGLFVDGTNGRVGIQTASPGETLHVVSSGVPARFERGGSTVLASNFFYNPNTTDNNGSALTFSTDTTGTGATTNQAVASIVANNVTHNHATRTATISFRAVQGGAGIATDRVTIGAGVQVGSPTGGDKGAGTINVAGDLFKNNTAYANPDYVLEQWSRGHIYQFRDRPGAENYQRLSLDEVESYIHQYYHLPRISRDPIGIFGMADIALEKIEELYTHVIELHHRLKRIENGN